MSVKIIEERLKAYNCQSLQEEQNAIREITQEIALVSLSRADFFKVAAFQGGTCLRVLYGLERFSEDMDFLLLKPDVNFGFQSFLKNMVLEFEAYGYNLKIEDRSKASDIVKKVFIKDDSIGKIITIYTPLDGFLKNIKIKLEVDTNPPVGSKFQTKYLDFPVPAAVTVQDLPSLFAGKCHALLCREYVKGRDWYDFLWYVGQKGQINYLFLANALFQIGPWKNKKNVVDKDWCIENFEQKIKTTNWDETKKELSKFVKPNYLETLNLWSTDFFLSYLGKMKSYLN